LNYTGCYSRKYSGTKIDAGNDNGSTTNFYAIFKKEVLIMLCRQQDHIVALLPSTHTLTKKENHVKQV
jgi:hypothetical protein